MQQQFSCAQDANSMLKSQELSVLDDHQESKPVKIPETGSFRQAS